MTPDTPQGMTADGYLTIGGLDWSAPEREPDGAWRMTRTTSTYTWHARLLDGKVRGLSHEIHAPAWFDDPPPDGVVIALLSAALAAAEQERDALLMAVGNKYPGESRYETALRYIRQAEKPLDAAAVATQYPERET